MGFTDEDVRLSLSLYLRITGLKRKGKRLNTSSWNKSISNYSIAHSGQLWAHTCIYVLAYNAAVLQAHLIFFQLIDVTVESRIYETTS